MLLKDRGMMQRLFVRISRISVEHPRIVLISALIITVIAGYFATQLTLQSHIEDFLPEDSPVVRAFEKAMERYGTSDHLIIVLEGTGEDDADARESLADIIAEKLSGMEEIKQIDYRIGEELQEFVQGGFLKYALIYLDLEELEKFKEKLSDEEIKKQVAENRRILLSPASIVAKEAINYDFLNLRSLYYKKIDLSKGKLKISFRDGYYFSEDLTMLLMFVKPVQPAQDLSFCRLLMEKVNRSVEEAQNELQEQEEEQYGRTTIGITGGYSISLAYDKLLKKDMSITILTTFIGIMLLYIIGFRRIFAPLYASIPLIIGIIWTMGFTYLTIGSINFFTGASAAVLMGLGIDISIHLYNRYLEEAQQKRSLRLSFEKTMSETGVGIFSAVITTVVAFYATLFSDFKGLLQLGFICGSGMLIILVATFFILPAMISIGVRSKLLRDRKRGMSNFGLDKMTKWLTKQYRLVIIICVGITVLSIVMILKINIEEDFLSLRPKGVPAIELQDKIVRKIGSPMIFTMVVGESNTERGIIHQSDEISRKLTKLIEKDYVVSYRSLSMILPPIDDQMRNIEWLKEQKRTDPSAFDMRRIRETLIDSLVLNGFRAESYAKIVDFLKSALSIDQPLRLSDLQSSSLRNIVERFVSANGEGYSQVTYVYPEVSNPDRDVFRILMDEMHEVDPSLQVVGIKILGMELKKLIKKSILVSSIIALFAVATLLFIHFRRPFYVLLTLVPLLAGVLWGFGVMVLLGFSFNLISITVLPLIFGIGIDNGIHIINRFLFDKENLRHIFHHTGRALLMTSATTIMGFGSLIFADYPGLVGVGAVAVFGVSATLISAVLFLPAILTALYHREKR